MTLLTSILTPGSNVNMAALRTWLTNASVVNVKEYGATGDGVTDDTAAIEAARDSGAVRISFPPGIYRTTGLVFNASDDVTDLYFQPGAYILVVAAASRIGVDIQKHNFTVHGRMDVRGTGTMSDGLATIAVRHGTVSVGYSYLTIEHLAIAANFSSRGFVSYGCVNVAIGRADINGGSSVGGATGYAMSFEPGASGCTMVKIGQAYLSGGRRSFNGEAASWVQIDTMAVEYGGRGGGNTDGALHLKQCATFVVANLYGEQNERNVVLDDSTPLFINKAMFTALTSADSVTYTAVAFADRGTGEITNRSIKIGEMLPDANVAAAVTTGLSLQGATTTLTVYMNGTQVLATRRTGWTAMTGTATRTVFDTATVTLPQLAQRVKALTDDLIAHGLIGA